MISNRKFRLRHHITVGLIDRLVVEQLVARVPLKEDRRQGLINSQIVVKSLGKAFRPAS